MKLLLPCFLELIFVKSEVNLALFTGDILPREDSEENAAKDTDKIADKDIYAAQ